MPADPQSPAPVLVLGVGNRLLRDDGVGLSLLELVHARCAGIEGVEFIDGGTQGLALLGLLDDRRAVLVLDAIARGAAPGTIHVIDDPSNDRVPHANTAHESSVSGLLGAAQLLGSMPLTLVVMGIEPHIVRTGIGLSDVVLAALPKAADLACQRLDQMMAVVNA